jgi:hypothetical protein
VRCMKDMPMGLDDAFQMGTVATVVWDTWEAVGPLKTVLTYESMARNGASDVGHLVLLLAI